MFRLFYVHQNVVTSYYTSQRPNMQRFKNSTYQSGWMIAGIRSASFQTDTLTIGTGLGMIMFYDLRANKYLESSINSTRTVVLKASRGYVVSNSMLYSVFSYN